MQVTQDLEATLNQIVASGVSPHQIVVVEEAPDYPGELVFQVVEATHFFYSVYKDWVSVYSVLSELANLEPFVTKLEADGWTVVAGPSADPILKNHERWSQPLKIEGYDLHPFQQFSLNRAFESDYWFFNWATGAGKSFVCAAGAKELFERDQIDVVFFCTLSKSKINQARFFETAGLDVVVNDGDKAKRRKVYKQRRQVYVANYEKMNFDAKEITELTMDRRVLWIFDETHKIVTDATPNKARIAFEKMWKVCAPGSKVWPMSASVVNGNPLRFRDVFSIGMSAKGNPLGMKYAFENRYANEVKEIPMKTKSGKSFSITAYDWNIGRLQEIRHRVGHMTQTARKTDPGVAPYFKGLATIVEPIQMSDNDHELSEIIIDKAFEAHKKDENLQPYYSLLRYVCNTPLALGVTDNEVGKLIYAENPKLCDDTSSAKIERLNEMLETIRVEGDKVVVFTHWTNLGLHLIAPRLTVPYVLHFGTGQTNAESQEAQDTFKSDPDITCFFTSDAGSHGLNMQCARFVIQLEPTYSYDDGMQRASRIDRSDSHLDGLTNYVMVTDDSVETRVWQINGERRRISEAIQGTQEVLSYGKEASRAQHSESENLAWLMFGDRI